MESRVQRGTCEHYLLNKCQTRQQHSNNNKKGTSGVSLECLEKKEKKEKKEKEEKKENILLTCVCQHFA